MPEFIPTLIGGLVLLAVLYAAVSLPQMHIGPSGAFAAKTADNHDYAMLAENVWVSSSLFDITKGEATVTKQAGWMLPFKDRPEQWEGGLLELTIKQHTGGVLVVKLNSIELYRGSPEAGTQRVEFPISYLDTSNVLEVNLEDWSPISSAKYSFDTAIYGTVSSDVNQTFAAPTSWKSAKLLVAFKSNLGDIIIRQDGKEIYKGRPSDYMSLNLDLGKTRVHNIEFIAPPRAKHLIDFAEVQFER
jgi:hypothetical protein